MRVVGRRRGGRGRAADALERRAMHRARFKAERRLPSRRRRLRAPPAPRCTLRSILAIRTPPRSPPSCSAASRFASPPLFSLTVFAVPRSLPSTLPRRAAKSIFLQFFPSTRFALRLYLQGDAPFFPPLAPLAFHPSSSPPWILTHFSRGIWRLDASNFRTVKCDGDGSNGFWNIT